RGKAQRVVVPGNRDIPSEKPAGCRPSRRRSAAGLGVRQRNAVKLPLSPAPAEKSAHPDEPRRAGAKKVVPLRFTDRTPRSGARKFPRFFAPGRDKDRERVNERASSANRPAWT